MFFGTASSFIERISISEVEAKQEAILFLFGCSKVNSTWIITSGLANERAPKALFTCVVYTNLGYSLFREWREKWRVVLRKFLEKEIKQEFFYPSDLVNTKTTIPLRVGEEQWIYVHHYSPPLWGIVE